MEGSCQTPNLTSSREKHQFYSESARQNSFSLVSPPFPLCLTSAVWVLRIIPVLSYSVLSRDSPSLVKWYSLAGVRFPSEVQVPPWVWRVGWLCLQVNPLKTFLNPSVLRRILFMEAESIFLIDLVLLRVVQLPEVTIISNSIQSNQVIRINYDPQSKIHFMRVSRKDQARRICQGTGYQKSNYKPFHEGKDCPVSNSILYMPHCKSSVANA